MTIHTTMQAARETAEAWIAMMGRGEVELNALRVFYIVASNGDRPIPQATLRDLTGLSEAAISRNVAVLSIGSTGSQAGPRLIESYEDPEYRRRKLVRMTAKGKRFAESIDAIGTRYAGVVVSKLGA